MAAPNPAEQEAAPSLSGSPDAFFRSMADLLSEVLGVIGSLAVQHADAYSRAEERLLSCFGNPRLVRDALRELAPPR